ncbi:MAG TPA: hypothetical protein VGB55_02585 [Tepidisphaeraceae bacterium]
MSVLSTYVRITQSFSRAAAKAASAKLRQVGWQAEAANWTARAEICERCPLLVVQCGKSYCGRPYLQLIDRDPSTDGCGCPCRAKAKDPAEHCPLTARHLPAARIGGMCDCKWCTAQH